MTINDLKLRWKQSILLLAAAIGILAVGAVGIGDLARSITEERRHKAQEMVEVAVRLIRHIDSQVAADRLSLPEAQEWAKEELRNLRFGESGYFWVIDTQARMVAHPVRRELENVDLAAAADPYGRAVAAAALQTIKTEGSGFIGYEWPKPGSDAAVHKVSFITLYGPWEWIVGTGLYIDDVREMIWTRTAFVGGIALTILVIVLAGSMWIARGVAIPLAAVTRSLVQLTEGRFSSPVPERSGGDEIGDLAGVNFYRQKSRRWNGCASKRRSPGPPAPDPAEGESRYRMLVATVPNAVLVHRNDEIIYANNVAASLFRAESPKADLHAHRYGPRSGAPETARTQRRNVLVSAGPCRMTEGGYRKLAARNSSPRPRRPESMSTMAMPCIRSFVT